MYKMSQDHLELFFGAVRAAGGCNSNPTTQQFTAAYKCLLLRSHISGGKGNCEKRDPIEILSAVTNSCKIKETTPTPTPTPTLTNVALIRKYDLQERAPLQTEHDYCDLPNVTSISEHKEAAISYMAGFVAKSLQKKLHCPNCRNVLGSQEAEKCFQRMLNTSGGKLPHGKGIVGAIAVTVLGAVKVSSLFTELDDHMYDSTVDDNHVHELINEIVNCYCKVRLYHMGKEYTAKLSAKNIRKQLTKLVLLNHQ